jgi:hypothetical protein
MILFDLIFVVDSWEIMIDDNFSFSNIGRKMILMIFQLIDFFIIIYFIL